MTPVEVALGYIESFASGDPAIVAAWVSDDFVNEHTSALGSGLTGRAAYLERLPEFLGGFEGLRYDVERTISEGSTVTVAYRLLATFDAHPIDIRGAMVIYVEGDLVARRCDYWDSLSFLRQAGQA